MGIQRYFFILELTMKDIGVICEKLHNARVQWFPLGMALKVDHNTLTSIEEENRGKHSVCLEKMIAHRIKNDKHPLTWQEICECLKKTTVGRRDVATEIEEQLSRGM